MKYTRDGRLVVGWPRGSLLVLLCCLGARLEAQRPTRVLAGVSALNYDRGGETTFQGLVGGLGLSLGPAEEVRLLATYWPNLRDSRSHADGWSLMAEFVFPALGRADRGPYLFTTVGRMSDANTHWANAPRSSAVYGFGVGAGVPIAGRLGVDAQALIRREFSAIDAELRGMLSYRIRSTQAGPPSAWLDLRWVTFGPGTYSAVEPGYGFRIGRGCHKCFRSFGAAAVWHVRSRSPVAQETWDTRVFPVSVGLATTLVSRRSMRLDASLGLQLAVIPEGPDFGLAPGGVAGLGLARTVGSFHFGAAVDASTVAWRTSHPQTVLGLGLTVGYEH